jgi:hypothetical protein
VLECCVRTNACCECGATTREETFIAIRTDTKSSFAAIVCDPDQT